VAIQGGKYNMIMTVTGQSKATWLNLRVCQFSILLLIAMLECWFLSHDH